MFRFNRTYFLLALGLFLVEVLIAMYVKDAIIRPYGGDFLVVIWLYCCVMAVVEVNKTKAAIGVLLFAYLIEILQYFRYAHRLGLEHNKVAMIVLGSSFEWGDMIAYTLGVLTVLLIEWRLRLKKVLQ
ncbi:Protein of unknown function [Chitinophaga terrae (ex Kim and Jung 2007)]|uniref:DUF2809 domain-containing protein n=1 Tax=Chitinophaga terrae (ex Kim and Jung 2007) TaxID=408074 RepID=A0A1H4FRM3_9BACT|nr:DUF2809 domain-containing protein [Chitinophaga terrae (ex Kim and Jung 2007)]MDQ0109671.1 hypothetical protein [Chitinophaga terrae (ex Kim and Jung 2007)]GEP92632.1 membrane protein [Chitinophaga terrae (ex Kim and Jung 2007)]SEA99162.1 Protein of unknown function [Chitinophaga terrae (ex Kim and Jung 2007)]